MPLARLTLLGAVLTTGEFTAVAASHHDWPAYFGDRGGTHYSTLDQINVDNVARLQPAWTFRTGGPTRSDRGQIQCNPLVIDGVLYGTTPDLKLFALDATNAREKWRFDPSDSGRSPGNGVNRGLTWWTEGGERRLFFAAGSFLFALDPATGVPIPSFGDNGSVDLSTGLDRDVSDLYLVSTTPGAVYRDLIIVSTRVGEGPAPAAPGHIRAYDVRTGERRWIFHTIPFPGEWGHDTWPPDAWQTAGGANCWPGLVVDEERGLAFVPTGSATFDFWGGDRLGDNLFANCLLALDAATGERVWHFQFVHHDVWDRDPPAAPVLCEVVRDGRRIPAVAQTLKSGHVWVFHRETGESLFPWREEPVPPSTVPGEVLAPTQPVPLAPAPFARQQFTQDLVTDRSPEAHEAVLRRVRSVRPHVPFDPPSLEGTIVFPGFDGGAEWGGAAVDPDGVLYVNSNEMAWILELVPTESAGIDDDVVTRYRQMCMSCHGPDFEGNAAQNIPSLVDVRQRLDQRDIINLLRTGKGVMPSFSFLPQSQLASLAEFIIGEESTGQIDPDAFVVGAPAPPPFATTGYNRFLDPDGYPAVKPPWGTLNAIDLNTGAFRWRIPLGEFSELTAQGIPPTGAENYGGPIVTAGDLVFIAATRDEKIRAFDRRTGARLWEANLPAAAFATPATYAVNGRQYVVIACGGGKIGMKSGDSYVAFALP